MPRMIPQEDFRDLFTAMTPQIGAATSRELRNPVVRAVCINIPHAVRTNLSEVVRSLQP